MGTFTKKMSWPSEMTNFLAEKGPDPKHSTASEAAAFIYSIPGFQVQACALGF